MIRRLMSLATLSVLVGVFVLSVSAYADGASDPGKTTTQTTSHQLQVVNPTVPTAAIKTPAVRFNLKDSFGFWLRRYLGLPPIQIETKPPENTEPLKVKVDPKANNWSGKPIGLDVDQDNGGSSGDF